jgi:hypothetical protein
MVFLARESLDCVDVLVYSARGTLVTFSIAALTAPEVVGSCIEVVRSIFVDAEG